MRQALTGKQGIILAAIRREMSSGKSMEEAVREVMKSKMFNHMTVQRCADKLARDPSLLNKFPFESEEKGERPLSKAKGIARGSK